jgi:transposase
LRLIAPIPHGHWKKSTLVAALSLDGIVAPYVMDGAMNGEIFLAYIRQMLAPLLKQGDILVMDNLSCHKVAGIREAVEARGARLIYLPPYSPDLNPIEQAFSKLKAMLRKAGARTKEALWAEIGRVIENYSQNECRNLFNNSGYAT